MNLTFLKKQAVISCLGIALFGLPGNALFAQNKSTRLDSLFTALAGLHEFNGNVLVAEKGHTVYSHSFGFADAENHMAATENTAFNLASVSKTFTAVAVLQLKQKGFLLLDDPFVKYFPEFPWPQ